MFKKCKRHNWPEQFPKSRLHGTFSYINSNNPYPGKLDWQHGTNWANAGIVLHRNSFKSNNHLKPIVLYYLSNHCHRKQYWMLQVSNDTWLAYIKVTIPLPLIWQMSYMHFWVEYVVNMEVRQQSESGLKSSGKSWLHTHISNTKCSLRFEKWQQ